MFTLVDLLQPNSIEEAYQTLVSRKNNVVLGGCAFLRLGGKRIGTGIDLSTLNLNYIKDQDQYIEVGAMTTLREIETCPLFINNFNGLLHTAVGNIIGVQFRNVVTVGASIFSKYGFSDLITALLVLDTEVELYKRGRIPLADFLAEPYQKDILTRVFIRKDGRKASYKSLRVSASDYPILTVAVSKNEEKWTLVVGARPRRAQISSKASEELSNQNKSLTLEAIENIVIIASNELSFGTNTRGSADYRKEMSKVLLKRAILEVLQCK